MAFSHQAPDLDGMEELVWASSLELGYTKHPPLPSWLMYFAVKLFGREIWLPFFMGILAAAAGLWFIWKLGCELSTPYKSFAATLLVSVTSYFALRATIYNHNTAQLWSITASIWLFYCALTKQKLTYWLFLGVVCALSMLTKYSALIQFAAFFAFFIRSAAWRSKQNWLGIALALCSFAIVFTPHVFWLIQNNFEPLRYADSSLKTSGYVESISDILWFIIDQIGRLSPILLALAAWAVWYYYKKDRGPGAAANDPSFNAIQKPEYYLYSFDQYQRQFLLWVGLTPFISTVIITLVLGSSLEPSWGSTFFVLIGFYALWLIRGDEIVQTRRILVIVALLHLTIALGYGLARGPIAQFVGYTARSTYPGAEISALAQQHWQEHQSGRPLRIVVANTWLGGNIAVHAGPQAQVFIEADSKESPWLVPGKELDCGAVIAFSDKGKGASNQAIQQLYEDAPWKGTDYVYWSGPKGKKIDFNWAVIPANENCLR